MFTTIDTGENTSGSSPPPLPGSSHVHHQKPIKKAPLRRSSQSQQKNLQLTGLTTQSSIIQPNPHHHHLQQQQHQHHQQQQHQQQPNLDERLRQYSAYELNRRPKTTSKTAGKGSKQSQSGDSELSCCGEDIDSSGSFFLHDPSTLSYNRLSDLFGSPNSSDPAQTVCSDDSGVGLNTSSPPNSASQNTANTTQLSTHNKPLSRPKSRPPKPPGIYILKMTYKLISLAWINELVDKI